MKIVALVGSIRKESFNKKLAAFIQKRYQDKADIEILNVEDLPFFNQDDELDPPSIVKEVKSKIRESDGVLIVTPEYNHSVPGVLKNAIDWCSRGERVMVDKPVMIVGSSPGMLGTARAQIHLRQILNSPGIYARTLPGNEVFINSVHEKVDDFGQLNDQPTVQVLDRVTDNFIEWIKTSQKV